MHMVYLCKHDQHIVPPKIVRDSTASEYSEQNNDASWNKHGQLDCVDSWSEVLIAVGRGRPRVVNVDSHDGDSLSLTMDRREQRHYSHFLCSFKTRKSGSGSFIDVISSAVQATQ